MVRQGKRLDNGMTMVLSGLPRGPCVPQSGADIMTREPRRVNRGTWCAALVAAVPRSS